MGKRILGLFDEYLADGDGTRVRAAMVPHLALPPDRRDDGRRASDDRIVCRPISPAIRLRCAPRSTATIPSCAKIFDVSWRTARLAAHETYMDAPYWEQLQYVGDTRVDALISMAMTGDDRLPRRAMVLFDQSRRSDGITQSRYPDGGVAVHPAVRALLVEMVHDHWMYVGDRRCRRTVCPQLAQCWTGSSRINGQTAFSIICRSGCTATPERCSKSRFRIQTAHRVW